MPPTGQPLGGDTFNHLPTLVIPIIAVQARVHTRYYNRLFENLTCTVCVQLVGAGGVVAQRQPGVTSGWVRPPDL